VHGPRPPRLAPRLPTPLAPRRSLTIRTHQGEAQQQRDQADRLSQPHDEEPPAAKKRKKGKSASVALNTSVAGAPRF
jgi:hypothetical protein